MRRFWIHNVLPVAFAVVPLLAAAMLFFAVPRDARGHYLDRVQTSPIDWIIITLGFTLFAVQVGLSWKALRWQESDFDTRADRWLSHLAQGAEWFPLLGLIGTVVFVQASQHVSVAGVLALALGSALIISAGPDVAPRPADAAANT